MKNTLGYGQYPGSSHSGAGYFTRREMKELEALN
jgi:hypothetical protein